MKKQLLMGSLAAAIMMVNAGSALAEDVGAGFDVSANVGVVSDYVWRGVSQSDNHGAIQGGLDLKHSSGVYAGTWMSSLNNNRTGPDPTLNKGNTGFADAEQDLYAGYGFNVTSDIALDLRYTAFTYVGAAINNFHEAHLGVSAYGVALSVDYSKDVDSIGSTWHSSLGYSYTLPKDISLGATFGHYDFLGNNLAYGNEASYNYWNLGVSKKIVGITWGLSYNDTSLSGSDCLAGTLVIGGDQHSCGEQFVLSATKAL